MSSASNTGKDDFYHGVFPQDFFWSSATASYQIEGAWNEDGKAVSIWDTFTHEPGRVINNETGDVTCDSYHHIDDDIKMIKNLGTSHYRFSLSWCRILPETSALNVGSVNKLGVDYYNRLIDSLLSQGVTPVITLYHWDLPQTLQDVGGWTNEVLVSRFNDYAKVCFELFGDRVKNWITFNEPYCIVWLGYGTGENAPGISYIKDPLCNAFNAAHTIIKAHATAWHTYDTIFRSFQKGQVAISLNAEWSEAKDSDNTDDVEAAERLSQFKIGWFANPIFGNGDYPDIVKAQLAKKAQEFGMSESPLPVFTDSEKIFNRGTWDFFGFNHYTTRLVSKLPQAATPPSSSAITDAELMDVQLHLDPTWKRAASDWLYVVPWGIRRFLNWIKYQYGNPSIYITENGFSDSTGSLDDHDRVDYYRRYINEVLKAIDLDGCDVRGYTAWSLMDNFEWDRGFSEHFGLHCVDFTDPARKRTPKASAFFYAQVIKDSGFP